MGDQRHVTLAGSPEEALARQVSQLQQEIEDLRGTVLPRAGVGGGAAELAYAQVTANQTGIGTSVTDLTGLSVSPTLTGKPIEVRVSLYLAKRTAVDTVSIVIRDVTAGAQVWVRPVTFVAVDQQFSIDFTARLAPAAGGRTYKAQMNCASAGTVDVLAAAAWPAYIQVKEVVVP